MRVDRATGTPKALERPNLWAAELIGTTPLTGYSMNAGTRRIVVTKKSDRLSRARKDGQDLRAAFRGTAHSPHRAM